MSSKERPNVVFITCDQFRGDCLGCLGHPDVETPHLDQLAHEGVVFTNAYSSVPSCIAARAAMLTGMNQKSHGRVGYQDGVIFDYPNTMPGELAKAGYHTQGVGKMHFYPPRNLCGFHNVVLHDGYLSAARKASRDYSRFDDYTPWLKSKIGNDADLILHGLNPNTWIARPWQYAEELHPTTWATSMGIDFLRRRDTTKPFFMWLSYVRPHPPFDPPQVYYDMYINREFPEVPMGDWADKNARMKTIDNKKGFMGKEQLHRAQAAYYAHITHIDHQIGRLIIYLREHDVLDNTMFIFTSDHGELLGDHNLFRKALPYRGSALLPFILTPPAAWGIKTPAANDSIVELMDVMPTVLDACGVEIPDTVDGKSLLPLCREENTEWRQHLHGEHAYGEESNHYIISEKYKYIWFSQSGAEQFFDLGKDPCELKNLIDRPEYSGKIDECRNILAEELAGREEGYSDGEKLLPGKTAKASLSFLEKYYKPEAMDSW